MIQTHISEVKEIGVLRTNSGLGDLIVCLPAIEALRHEYPNAKIILFGLPWHMDLVLDRRTPIDQVIVVPEELRISRQDTIASNSTVMEFGCDLYDLDLDILFNFQNEGKKSMEVARYITCQHKIGFDYEGSVSETSGNSRYYQNEVIRFLGLVNHCTNVLNSMEPKIEILPSDLTDESALIKQLHILHPYLVLHVGAMDMRRRWPLKKFALIADEFRYMGFEVILAGGEMDEHEIMEVMAHMKTTAITYYQGVSLIQLAIIQQYSQLVISNDTGPLHLARAVGAKTLGLYWAPNFINWGPLQQQHHRVAIDWVMSCPHCGITPNNPYPFEPKDENCQHELSFIRNIKAEEVLALAMELLPCAKDKRAFIFHA